MNLFSTLRNRIQTSREEGIRQQAESLITLCDFEGKIYIAFNGNPLVAVEEDIYPADILKKLCEIRENYVTPKLKTHDGKGI